MDRRDLLKGLGKASLAVLAGINIAKIEEVAQATEATKSSFGKVTPENIIDALNGFEGKPDEVQKMRYGYLVAMCDIANNNPEFAEILMKASNMMYKVGPKV